MQGHKQFVDKVVLRFSLSERIPKQNLYRRLAELLDWDFLYAQTQPFYSHTGQPSLDPVVFFKLMLVSRLENLVSDRQLIAHCSLRLDILYFLGYEVDEDLPWHSTISRTRQLYPATVFEHLFEHVLAQCVAAGLVTGHTQAVDSAPVKANASLESLCDKQDVAAATPVLHVRGDLLVTASPAAPAGVVDSPAHQMRRVATQHARYRRNTSGPLGRSNPQARLLSNKIHYSPTDPEARISVKPGKVRALNYLCSMAVDEAHGVISHIQADFADRRDSTLLPSIVAPLQQRLLAQDLPLRELAADTGYSNGVNYALLEAQGITPWIPVFGKYKPEIDGFVYNGEADSFTCPAGKQLPFKNFHSDLDGRLGKRYTASRRDCGPCPHKPTCAPNLKKRQLIRTAYAAHYQRALTRQQSQQGQRMRQLRQRTVEPVFGSLLQHYGLRRVNTRGRSSAHKTMLLAAIAFKLKKLLKPRPNRVLRLAVALPRISSQGRLLRGWNQHRGRYSGLASSGERRPIVLQQPPCNSEPPYGKKGSGSNIRAVLCLMTPPLAPLSRAAALELAQAHVARLNAQAPPPGTRRWIVRDPIEYTPYWYFDYQTDAVLTWSADHVPDLADCFSYPPGYLLWKHTHACSLVGWGELSTLDLREQLDQQALGQAQWLVTEPLGLAQLRPHLRAPLPELVQFTQQVRTLPDTAAQVAHLFDALHEQALHEARLPSLHSLRSVSRARPTCTGWGDYTLRRHRVSPPVLSAKRAMVYARLPRGQRNIFPSV